MKWWETLWKQDVEKDTWKDPDPDEITIDLKLFSTNAFEISTTPLSTPPEFNDGTI